MPIRSDKCLWNLRFAYSLTYYHTCDVQIVSDISLVFVCSSLKTCLVVCVSELNNQWSSMDDIYLVMRWVWAPYPLIWWDGQLVCYLLRILQGREITTQINHFLLKGCKSTPIFLTVSYGPAWVGVRYAQIRWVSAVGHKIY